MIFGVFFLHSITFGGITPTSVHNISTKLIFIQKVSSFFVLLEDDDWGATLRAAKIVKEVSVSVGVDHAAIITSQAESTRAFS